MSDELARHGLFYDDLHTLRVLEPQVATETQDLVDECSGYAEKLEQFQRISEEFLTITEALSQKVDRAKMRTIAVQTLLKSTNRQRAAEQQRMQNEIAERTLVLERLKIELQYLQRVECEQQETIDTIYQTQ